MKYLAIPVCLAGLGLVCVLALAAGSTNGDRPAHENLDRYIGRSLVEDGRAERAGVHRMLPIQCPPFFLRDETGDIIEPLAPGGDLRPVSTRQTCGMCHPYDVIAQGYHFQAGRRELYSQPPAGEPLPPHRGPGFFGKWQLLYQRELAPREFSDPRNIDLTPFEWVQDCGVCHPGGGPAEVDRAGRRYDRVLRMDPGLALFGDSDYYQARWDVSGVAEVDCFMCHLDHYEFSTRAQQLKKQNFRWAATAAANLGYVWGSIEEGEAPNVYYNLGMFRADGTVLLDIVRPTDRHCMTCHDFSGVEKRGTTWHSHYVQDVHTEQGMSCTDCHANDIRHNFAKGSSTGLSTAARLDSTMMSCEECHETGEKGAPRYDHPGLPRLHFDVLSCQACHITHRPYPAVRTVDTITGSRKAIAVNPELGLFEDWAFGAQWVRLAEAGDDSVLMPFTAAGIERAASMPVGPDHPIRTASPAPAELPEETFTVRDYVEAKGLESEAARHAMLSALSEEAGEGYRAACLFRGTAYTLANGQLLALPTEIEPRTSGPTIAEYPLTFAVKESDGLIYPREYQLGVFWAYRDGDLLRPLFLKDMEAAWDLLHSEEYRFYLCEPKAGSGLGNPAEMSENAARQAVDQLLAMYDEADREPMRIWDDANDGHPEANREREIGLFAWALGRTLARVSDPELYYIRGTRAWRVAVEGGEGPLTGPLTQIPPIPAGEPFMAVERSEYVRYVHDYTFHWRWDFVETRVLPMYEATVEEIDPADDPAVAALAQPLSWTIGHGVEPVGRALGVSCTDCHSTDSQFYFGKIVLDPCTEDGTPRTAPNYETLGYSRAGVVLGAWREGVLKPAFMWVLGGVLAAMMVHLAAFGLREREEQKEGYGPPDTLRFNTVERMVHLAGLAIVMFLAVTGFFFLMGKADPLGPWARTTHTWFGYAAIGAVAVMCLVWGVSMLPARGDLRWLMGMGGYLGGKGHYPAGKFNAGQKLLFWAVSVLMAVLAVTGVLMAWLAGTRDPHLSLLFTIHDVAGLLMIICLMGHIYLAAVVNPHSMRSLFGGRVSRVWARKHHPDWTP